MPSDLDQWRRLSGQHMTRNDSCFQPYTALWFSRRFSKSPLLQVHYLILFCFSPNGYHFRQFKTADRSYIGASLKAFSQEDTVDVQAIVQLGRSRPQRVLPSRQCASWARSASIDSWTCGDALTSPVTSPPHPMPTRLRGR
jgi:hypothetical protein